MHCFNWDRMDVIDSPVRVNTTANKTIVNASFSRHFITVTLNEEEQPLKQTFPFGRDFSLEIYPACNNANIDYG